MRIGIVGSDDRAKAIGRLLRNGGHELSIADPTAKERAGRVAAEIGARQDTPYNQAMSSQLLVMAVPRDAVDTAVKAVGSGSQAVIVDAVADEHGNGALSGSELLAAKLDSNRLVRALINMPQSGANIAICGNDENAKALVDRALRACGCLTTDRGSLVQAAELEVPAAA